MENISVNIENLSSEKREQLRALVAEANKPRRWKLKNGDLYYYVTGDGDIWRATYGGSEPNRGHAKFNNYYRTREEAEFAREKAFVLAELQTYADENNDREVDWNDHNQRKWHIVFHHDGLHFGFDYLYECQHHDAAYFTSKEIAEKAIHTVGEARIKKYLFGVES